jgi:hypothetical protein
MLVSFVIISCSSVDISFSATILFAELHGKHFKCGSLNNLIGALIVHSLYSTIMSTSVNLKINMSQSILFYSQFMPV